MVSNQLIVEVLDKMRDISDTKVLVYTADDIVVSADNVNKTDAYPEMAKIVESSDNLVEKDQRIYIAVREDNHIDYVLTCPDGEANRVVLKVLKSQIDALINSDQERDERENFIKNLLLDNLLIVDIYNRAKKLHIDTRSRRVTFLVETKIKDDVNALETLRSMFAENENDFVSVIDENSIIIVHELKNNEDDETMKVLAKTISDMLNMEAMSSARVAYGNIADEIRKVSTSYKEAKLALSVGRIFNSDQNIVSYSALGIGRLIYQLPMPMCKMFIEEIFHGQSPENYDEDTLNTINRFFENNLNVSETSRQLFCHRNTLVYRLDKLQKNTGLDLRTFDDAITFKIALMVVKYMNYKESQE